MTFQEDIFQPEREGELIITLPRKPEPWRRTTRSRTTGKRINTQAQRDYYESIAWHAARQVTSDWRGHVDPVELEVLLGKDFSQLRITRDPHARRIHRGDLSNYLKAIEDGLQGILWADDKQIARVLVEERAVVLDELTIHHEQGE